MPQYDLTEEQRDTLIRTALGEARGQGEEGMADVLNVIFNRANSGRYPNDPAAVALQPSQFSTWNSTNNGGNNPRQFSPNSQIYQTAARALDSVVEGRPDPTGGALFYHTPAVNPAWASEANTNGTIRRNGHIFYPTHPVPPGEIPSVGTFLDTVRMPPQPQTQTGVGRFLRNNTSPLGDNTALPGALARVATTQANRVTPAIRGGQPTRNSGEINSMVRSLPQDNAMAQALAARLAPPRTNAPQSQIGQGASRLPIAQSALPYQPNNSDPGVIQGTIGALGSNPLAASLARVAGERVSGRPRPEQSQIERTAPRIGQSQIERTGLPVAPANLISQSMQNIASTNPTRLPPIPASTIGQPPSERVVRSVPMPPISTVPAQPRVTVSTPSTVPQRMAAQDSGNVARSMPVLAATAAPAVARQSPLQTARAEQSYNQSRSTAAAVASIAPAPTASTGLTQAQRLAILSTPAPSLQPTPINVAGAPNGSYMANKGLERLIPQGLPQVGTALSVTPPVRQPIAATPVAQIAPVQAQAVRPPAFSAPILAASAPIAQPRVIQAPMMAQAPLRIEVNGANVIPQPMTRVQQLQAQGMTNAQAYALLNSGPGSINNSDAANRINGSSTRGSGGARSLLD